MFEGLFQLALQDFAPIIQFITGLLIAFTGLRTLQDSISNSFNRDIIKFLIKDKAIHKALIYKFENNDFRAKLNHYGIFNKTKRYVRFIKQFYSQIEKGRHSPKVLNSLFQKRKNEVLPLFSYASVMGIIIMIFMGFITTNNNIIFYGRKIIIKEFIYQGTFIFSVLSTLWLIFLILLPLKFTNIRRSVIGRNIPNMFSKALFINLLLISVSFGVTYLFTFNPSTHIYYEIISKTKNKTIILIITLLTLPYITLYLNTFIRIYLFISFSKNYLKYIHDSFHKENEPVQFKKPISELFHEYINNKVIILNSIYLRFINKLKDFNVKDLKYLFPHLKGLSISLLMILKTILIQLRFYLLIGIATFFFLAYTFYQHNTLMSQRNLSAKNLLQNANRLQFETLLTINNASKQIQNFQISKLSNYYLENGSALSSIKKVISRRVEDINKYALNKDNSCHSLDFNTIKIEETSDGINVAIKEMWHLEWENKSLISQKIIYHSDSIQNYVLVYYNDSLKIKENDYSGILKYCKTKD